MKKLIALAMVMMGTAAMAVSSSNIFGILRVDSTAEETIISVPWIETDSSCGDIKVADLVLTSNLTPGDRLYYYTQGGGADAFAYQGWMINAERQWEPMTTVSQKRLAIAAGADTTAVPRGKALILTRSVNHDQPIYLYGQYTAGVTEVTVASGSKDAPAYTLLAPSDPNGKDLNAAGVMSGTPGEGDMIVLNDVGVVLQHDATRGWCVKRWDKASKQWVYDTAPAHIPAGEGVWYVSRGGAPKFTW